MGFFEYLENTGLARFINSSTSVWVYPTILTLHAMGLAFVLGASLVIDLRLLGFARLIPLGAMKKLFIPIWIGLATNTVSGILLFVPDAIHKSGQWIFQLKLSFILVGFIVLLLIRPVVLSSDEESATTAISGTTKVLAALSLLCWSGAIIAGRLTAYVGAN